MPPHIPYEYLVMQPHENINASLEILRPGRLKPDSDSKLRLQQSPGECKSDRGGVSMICPQGIVSVYPPDWIG